MTADEYATERAEALLGHVSAANEQSEKLRLATQALVVAYRSGAASGKRERVANQRDETHRAAVNAAAAETRRVKVELTTTKRDAARLKKELSAATRTTA